MDSVLSWIVFMWLMGSAIVVACAAFTIATAWAVDSAFSFVEAKLKERRIVQEK